MTRYLHNSVYAFKANWSVASTRDNVEVSRGGIVAGVSQRNTGGANGLLSYKNKGAQKGFFLCEGQKTLLHCRLIMQTCKVIAFVND